jgi:RNA polymerase sigma-70 factor (ECF subfamily)
MLLEDELRLSRLATHWTLLRRSQEQSQGARAAQEELLARYRPAVHRYLLAVVRDAHVADDLAQEFCLKFVRGDFHRATPTRGRFRDYIKTVLYHLVTGHHRRRPFHLSESASALEAAAAETPSTPSFDESWRTELLERAWNELLARRPIYHAALRFHVDNPELPTVALAFHLGRERGMPMTGVSARQTLHRARQLFAQLLFREVRESLADPTPEQIETELRELNLWAYCQAQVEAKE